MVLYKVVARWCPACFYADKESQQRGTDAGCTVLVVASDLESQQDPGKVYLLCQNHNVGRHRRGESLLWHLQSSMNKSSLPVPTYLLKPSQNQNLIFRVAYSFTVTDG